MKIIVFGATGGVGQHVVKMAVEAGHEVTAFVRTPSKLQTTADVNIVKGDAFDAQSVAQAIVGHDAVISCVGSSTGMKKSNELEQMGKNIADGMAAANVSRIAYCASAGVDKEIPGIAGKMMMTLLKNPLADHRAALQHYKAHNFNLTVARPMGLKDDALSTTYAEAFEGVPGTSHSIPRASVAHFLVKSLSDSRYDNTSVGLAL